MNDESMTLIEEEVLRWPALRRSRCSLNAPSDKFERLSSCDAEEPPSQQPEARICRSVRSSRTEIDGEPASGAPPPQSVS